MFEVFKIDLKSYVSIFGLALTINGPDIRPTISAVSTQFCLPQNTYRAPLMVIYKKVWRYGTSRGRMTFKTEYFNRRDNFDRIRPVARF